MFSIDQVVDDVDDSGEPTKDEKSERCSCETHDMKELTCAKSSGKYDNILGPLTRSEAEKKWQERETIAFGYSLAGLHNSLAIHRLQNRQDTVRWCPSWGISSGWDSHLPLGVQGRPGIF